MFFKNTNKTLLELGNEENRSLNYNVEKWLKERHLFEIYDGKNWPQKQKVSFSKLKTFHSMIPKFKKWLFWLARDTCQCVVPILVGITAQTLLMVLIQLIFLLLLLLLSIYLNILPALHLYAFSRKPHFYNYTVKTGKSWVMAFYLKSWYANIFRGLCVWGPVCFWGSHRIITVLIKPNRALPRQSLWL